MKNTICAVLALVLTSFAWVGQAHADESVQANTPSFEPLLVEFELFVLDNKGSTLMTSASVASRDASTPVSVSREMAYVASMTQDGDTNTLIPATIKEGVSVNIKREENTSVFHLELAQVANVEGAEKAGEASVAQTTLSQVVFPLVKGQDTHVFKAFGKKYKVVVNTKTLPVL